MITGGYVNVDCAGLNLLSQSSQKIDGLYAQLEKAAKSKMEVVACNCLWGTLEVSPIPVILIHLESDLYTATASTLQIRVKDDDTVTIVNFIS